MDVNGDFPLFHVQNQGDRQVITSLLEQHGQGGACAENDPPSGRDICLFHFVPIFSGTSGYKKF